MLGLFLPIALTLRVSLADYDEYWDGGGSNEDWGTGGNWADDSAPGTVGDAIINMRDNFDGKRNSYYNYGNGDNFKHVKFMTSLSYFMDLNCDTGAGNGLGLNGNVENYSSHGVNFYPRVYFRHAAPVIRSDNSTLYMKSTVVLDANNTTLLYQSGNSQTIVMDGPILKGDLASNCEVKLGSSYMTVEFKNAGNAYDGQTTISYGTLKIYADECIPNGSGLWIDADGVFDKNQKTETVKYVGGAGRIWTGNGGGNLIYAGNDSYTFSGKFTDNSSLVKKGTGTWTLSGDSSSVSFSGNIYAVGGTLRLSHNGAAGTSGTIYLGEQSGSADAATLAITQGVSIARAVVVRDQGSGTRTIAAHGSSGTATLTGGVTLNTNATLSADSGCTLEISTTAVTGSKNIVKSGAGTVKLSASNTYSGSTTINSGTLTLGHATDTLAGDITVSGGTLDVDNPDTVGAVTLTSGTISGDSALTGSSYDVRSGTISAALAGSVALTKSTSGTVTLSGQNTYSGATTVSAGTLQVNGSVTGSGDAVAVAGGTLAGTGSVGRAVNVAAGGVLAPGSAGLGTLTLTNGLAFTGGTFSSKIASTNANGYGQAVVSGGNVALGNGVASLSLDAASYAGSNGDMICLIRNSGSGSTTGYFTGLPANSTVSAGGRTFFIVYDANFANKAPSGGKDVALVSTGVATGALYEVE